MPRSSETPPSGRALLVTGLRRCDGITRGCPYQATSQHHGKEQQTSIEAPAARHSGAGRNPETTRDIATPAQTGTPRPKPHQTPHWVPACAGTTVSNECALSGGRAAPTVDHQHRPREPHTAVIPAKAGIQNPRRLSQHAPKAGGQRPVPRQPPHWVPACAGTTVSNAGAFPDANRTHKRGEQQTPPQARNTRHSGEGRNPEPASGTATYARGWRRTPGASSSAAPAARTGTPRPKPHPAPNCPPTRAGTTGSRGVAPAPAPTLHNRQPAT